MRQIAIFDMDGTLIDSGKDITISINHVRREHYALPPLSIQTIIDAINAQQRNLAEIFYETPVYEEQDRALFEEHYHEQCIQNVQYYDGIHEVLGLMEKKGFKMGVATNAPSRFAKRMLHHLKLDRFFPHIVGADNVDSPKPDPQMLHRVLQYHRYEAHRDRAWMIGDNLKDMEAAKQAGIQSIFAAWGFSRRGEGDYLAHHPSALIDIIEQ